MSGWLAGLLEGEGCFYVQPPRGGRRARLMVVLEMSDRDTVERAAALMGAPSVTRRAAQQAGHKDSYVARVTGQAAEEVMRDVRPFMGLRRGAYIDAALSTENLSHA